MTAQWNSSAIGQKAPVSVKTEDGDPFVVILMQGKNTFGDRIYSYLKTTLPDIQRMQDAIKAGNPFNPSDFGSVVAAGKGEPDDEIKMEIASMYTLLENKQTAAAPATPAPEQKAWDDF